MFLSWLARSATQNTRPASPTLRLCIKRSARVIREKCQARILRVQRQLLPPRARLVNIRQDSHSQLSPAQSRLRKVLQF